jgi:hypothetical protein
MYRATLDVGRATSARIPDPPVGVTHYAVVTAYAFASIESLPSKEVSYSGTAASGRDFDDDLNGDLNGDLTADLLFQNSAGQIAAWHMDGTGSASSTGWIYGGGLGDWEVVGTNDINSDGFADLVLQNDIGQIYAWFLDGTAREVNFSTGSGLKPGSKMLYSGGLGDWRVMGVNDINSDGSADLVLQNTSGQLYVWFLDGIGREVNFSTGSGLKPGSKMLYSAGLGDWRAAGVSDINSDGFADLILQNSSGQIYAWFLDGTGREVNFSTGSGLRPGSKMLYSGGLGDWQVAGVNDINGDGFADFVFQNTIGQIYAWFLDGTGKDVDFSTGSGLKPGSKLLYSSGLADWRIR